MHISWYKTGKREGLGRVGEVRLHAVHCLIDSHRNAAHSLHSFVDIFFFFLRFWCATITTLSGCTVFPAQNWSTNQNVVGSLSLSLARTRSVCLYVLVRTRFDGINVGNGVKKSQKRLQKKIIIVAWNELAVLVTPYKAEIGQICYYNHVYGKLN